MTAGVGMELNDLVKAFRGVGLEDGDSVIVHSSFRSLGSVEDGPGTVIRALIETVGVSGNLMLPTFNYTRPVPEPYYDPEETPGRTGIITELGRKWPGAVRSLHPTHSVTVIGPDADKLTRDHLECRVFGIGSPIDRLAKMGGKILLIGVTNASSSMIHVGEEYAGIPKVSWYDDLPSVKIKMPDGTIKAHQIDTSSSCSAAFGAVDYVLRRKGHICDARTGRCLLQLMRGSNVIEAVCDMIKDKPDILLCTWPECKPCAGARKKLIDQGRITPQ